MVRRNFCSGLPSLFFIASNDLRFATEAYLEADDALRQHEKQGEVIEALLSAQSIYYAWLFMERYHVYEPVRNIGELTELIEEMFAPVLDDTERLFGFRPAERWSFTVFLFTEKTETLIPIWREQSRNHPSSGASRGWRVGVGHAGVTFAKGSSIITSDATKLDYFENENTRKRYDRDVYKSMTGVPIGRHDNGDVCYGVLTATSDRIGRFDPRNTFPLRMLATIIANILIAREEDDVAPLV